MTAERFTAGQLFIERTKHREGPPVVYSVMCGNRSMLFTNHKALLRWVKWPSKTPTGDALREWLASFDEKPKAPAIEPDWAKIKSEIPPVAVDPITGEEMQDDAMANTKMCFERFVCK